MLIDKILDIIFSRLVSLFGFREILGDKISRADIAKQFIDLRQAKKNLTDEEFKDVLELYEYYQNKKQRYYLNDEQLLRLIMNVVETIDFLVSYKKCCGQNGAKVLEMLKFLRENDIALF